MTQEQLDHIYAETTSLLEAELVDVCDLEPGSKDHTDTIGRGGQMVFVWQTLLGAVRPAHYHMAAVKGRAWLALADVAAAALSLFSLSPPSLHELVKRFRAARALLWKVHTVGNLRRALTEQNTLQQNLKTTS